MAYSVPAENFFCESEPVGERRQEKIYKWARLCLQRWRPGEGGGVNSLTISEPECSTFYGLSALLLMCEEITLFPTPLKITT